MNEQKLMDAVAAATGGSNAATSEAVDASSRRSLTPSRPARPIQLIGFGSFSTGTRNARSETGDVRTYGVLVLVIG
ncbi:HU family DNA-binding protein [Paraburkholderia sp. SIMBA_054]|uniref:HU family DNA-binding protein n=1 Tax=Paraburkholderia sp. SIMBA_054 TaxID=3085795 RepID=UPI00397B0001